MLKPIAKCYPNIEAATLAAVGSDIPTPVPTRARVIGVWRDPELERYEALAEAAEAEYLARRYNGGRAL